MKKYVLILLQIFFALSLDAQIYKYTSTNLNLRAESNSKSKILAVLPQGTEIIIQDECNCEWLPISYDGKVGYVYTKHLSNNKTVSTKAAPTSSIKYYTNSAGERVQSPTRYNSSPAGATALCRDGTYSFSRNRRGTCSHHGGVARWL